MRRGEGKGKREGKRGGGKKEEEEGELEIIWLGPLTNLGYYFEIFGA